MNRDALKGLIFLGLLCLAAAAYPRLFTAGGLAYQVLYDDAESLKVGDSVYLKGVEVGEVLDVALLEDLTVRVDLRVRDRYKGRISKDLAHVIVNDKLLFGKKAVMLVPVGPRLGPIEPGSQIKGTASYADLAVKVGATRARSLWNEVKQEGDRAVRWVDRMRDWALEQVQESGTHDTAPATPSPGLPGTPAR